MGVRRMTTSARRSAMLLTVLVGIALAACSGPASSQPASSPARTADSAAQGGTASVDPQIKHVFVIVLENESGAVAGQRPLFGASWQHEARSSPITTAWLTRPSRITWRCSPVPRCSAMTARTILLNRTSWTCWRRRGGRGNPTRKTTPVDASPAPARVTPKRARTSESTTRSSHSTTSGRILRAAQRLCRPRTWPEISLADTCPTLASTHRTSMTMAMTVHLVSRRLASRLP